jgi:hypothetical protein
MMNTLIAMQADGNQGSNGTPHMVGFLAFFTINCSRKVDKNQTVIVDTNQNQNQPFLLAAQNAAKQIEDPIINTKNTISLFRLAFDVSPVT